MKFMKIHTPCSENWEQMTPNDQGAFCKQCAKNVIDFTSLSPEAIAQAIKSNRGKMCARVSSAQLTQPLTVGSNAHDIQIPYAPMAASVLLASALTVTTPMQATAHPVPSEVVMSPQNTTEISSYDDVQKRSKAEVEETLTLEGKITDSRGWPVENARVILVTIHKLYDTYSLKDGSYALELPKAVLNDANVIRVIYDAMDTSRYGEFFYGLESEDFILSKDEVLSNYAITGRDVELMLGGIRWSNDAWKPVVISNGVEIKYKQFLKAQQGEKSRFSLENKSVYYFYSKEAIAIYGQKAKQGLILLFEDEN